MRNLLVGKLVTGFTISSPANSFSPGSGNSANAPWQEKAGANCFNKAIANSPPGKKERK